MRRFESIGPMALRAAALVAATMAATPARADGWNGSLALASEKILRGVSQSDGRPAAMFDLNAHTDTGWAAAFGLAGPVYRTRDAKAEWTLGASKSWQLSPDWALQLGATHYAYVGGGPSHEYAYDEATLMLGWQGRVTGSIAWSPDTSGNSETYGWHTARAVTAELSLHQRLAGRLALDAGVGYYDLSKVRDAGYGYSSLGLSWGIGPVQSYLAYVDSRAAAHGLVPASRAGGRWVASLLWNF